jgi:hypothetical protein
MQKGWTTIGLRGGWLLLLFCVSIDYTHARAVNSFSRALGCSRFAELSSNWAFRVSVINVYGTEKHVSVASGKEY